MLRFTSLNIIDIFGNVVFSDVVLLCSRDHYILIKTKTKTEGFVPVLESGGGGGGGETGIETETGFETYNTVDCLQNWFSER